MKENQTSFQNGLLTTLPTISQTRRTQKSLHSPQSFKKTEMLEAYCQLRLLLFLRRQ